MFSTKHFKDNLHIICSYNTFPFVTGYRYMIHLYCLAVQAGFYSDVVECRTLSPADRVRSPVGEKCYFHFFTCYIFLYFSQVFKYFGSSVLGTGLCHLTSQLCLFMRDNKKVPGRVRRDVG